MATAKETSPAAWMVVTVRRTSPAAWDLSRGYQCQYLCCPLALKPVGVSCNHGHCIMMIFFRHCGIFFLVQCGVRFCTIHMFDGYWCLFFFFILTQICQGTIFVVPVISTSLFILDSAVFGALSHLFVMMFFSLHSSPLLPSIHLYRLLYMSGQDCMVVTKITEGFTLEPFYAGFSRA